MTTDQRAAAQAFVFTVLLAVAWLAGAAGVSRFEPCPNCRMPAWNSAVHTVWLPAARVLRPSCPGCYD